MGTRFALTLMFVLAASASCGYTPQSGTLPGGGNEIRVPIAKNKTAYPGLAGPFTAALRQRLARSGIRVVSEGDAPRLEVIIVDVNTRPGMLTARKDRLSPVDSIESIVAEYKLTDAAGVSLVEPDRIEVSGRAYSGGSPLAEESLGQRRRQALRDALADDIALRLFDQRSLP
jgi:hypothetical protein